ncbi:hypothetical protein VNO77_17630 [Canavalia gladiata]|uniref:Uncharacterized protein n=1 Tax=Canavalia gladiata TaxID=3824 RepID=A0AAN9QJJ1_CANGL
MGEEERAVVNLGCENTTKPAECALIGFTLRPTLLALAHISLLSNLRYATIKTVLASSIILHSMGSLHTPEYDLSITCMNLKLSLHPFLLVWSLIASFIGKRVGLNAINTFSFE